MELIVFDLDGTLLNRDSKISAYTGETLKLLAERGIAYTIATGRTLHGARAAIDGHVFRLPQAYKNGVMIWHPDENRFSDSTLLTASEVGSIVDACRDENITPFVFSLEDDNSHSVYYRTPVSDIERQLLDYFGAEEKTRLRRIEELDPEARVTHVNAIADGKSIDAVLRTVEDEPHLVAYSGTALEGDEYRWMDVHHSDASKGGAVAGMKELLGFERVICFGDSENDLSMFATADECYAPENAKTSVKNLASGIIGHHDEDGIARFLRERFELDIPTD